MVVDVKLVKIGNSLSFRVPKLAVEALHLSEGSTAELTIKENELVLKPKKAYTLAGLLAGVSKSNLHHEYRVSQELGAERIDE